MGEVLIDTEGHVVRVWAVHEVDLQPPFPPFNQSIVDAIEEWEFEPTVVGGEPTSVCLGVTTLLNWP